MSNEMPIKGSKWRRKRDGLPVTVSRVDDYFYDVYWRVEGDKRKGVLWVGNFHKSYEPITDVPD